MEDILDVYEMPYDPKRPVICMDEKPYQLLGETKEPLPMRPGDTQKTDSEYMDNLNIHAEASLYKPEEARRLAKRLEIHHTLVHGSWLNIAEIELNAMTRQCLARRIDTLENLNRELEAWEQERNAETRTVNWHFKSEDAREKLKSLYPKFS